MPNHLDTTKLNMDKPQIDFTYNLQTDFGETSVQLDFGEGAESSVTVYLEEDGSKEFHIGGGFDEALTESQIEELIKNLQDALYVARTKDIRNTILDFDKR